MVSVMQGSGYLFDSRVLRDNQVKSSGDEVNVRIDLGSFGNDGLYSRMRTANHQYDALRRVNGERQLFQFPGPRRVGYQGDQGNAGGHFRGLVDQLNVRSGKGCTEFHRLGRHTTVVAHLGGQRRVFTIKGAG